ncbi:unnamed protein product [Urochloa humidicola]
MGRASSAKPSPRHGAPACRRLTIQDARGLHDLTIHSDPLKAVLLEQLHGLQQLTITASMLEELGVVQCFICDHIRQPVANISVPQLKWLNWADAYDLSSVHLSKIEQLKSLSTVFAVYGPNVLNDACLMFMPRIKVIEHLNLLLRYVYASTGDK